jgi:hypothetical protein
MLRSLRRFSGGHRFVGGFVGSGFALIGLIILISLWVGAMGDPPLIFRLVGSFISLSFMVVGGAIAFAAIRGGSVVDSLLDQAARPAGPGVEPRSGEPGAALYECDACGAPLTQGAEISPRGDVKCTFCKAWFNVRQR